MEPEERCTQTILVTIRAHKPAMITVTACGVLTQRNNIIAGVARNGTI
jgi:hypothetical protein